MLTSCFAHGGVGVEPPFETVSVREAFERYVDLEREAVLRMAALDEDAYFLLLVERVESALALLPHAV